MVNISPTIRYMLLCEDWEIDTEQQRRVSIFGLTSSIRSADEEPYPLMLEELCVFITATGGRGRGPAQILCVDDETDQWVFGTPQREVQFPDDPLEVLLLPFRILNVPIPSAGRYRVQFWYDGKLVDERPLTMR